MSRLRNSLIGSEEAIRTPTPEVRQVKYGMARSTGNELEFEFSENGVCDSWVIVKYEDVSKYTTLSPVRCQHDGKFYPFFEFTF
jgi:hypothetical protein